MDSTNANMIVAGSGLALLVLDIATGKFKKSGALSIEETGANILSFINFLAIRAAAVVFWSWLLVTLFPTAPGFLLGVSALTVFIVFTLTEEYSFYWFHRLAHTTPWLWRLHKTHHTPEHLNIGVTFRENWLWFVLIPSGPLGALLVVGGYPEIAVVPVAWKGASAFMVHTATRWDLVLYRFWLTRPIMLVIEKIVILPDTHHAHHGVGRYGHGMCNFGSFFCIFDVLHGTARFPHHEQDAFGVPKSVKVEPWYEQLWWPLGQSKAIADLHPPTPGESQRLRTISNGRFTITM